MTVMQMGMSRSLAIGLRLLLDRHSMLHSGYQAYGGDRVCEIISRGSRRIDLPA
jgi:hypothetical protein